METRYLTMSIALVLMLTGTVAHADKTKHLQCTFSSSGVTGVETNLDTNGDGISAGVTQGIANCGRFRFFLQNESEFLAPVPATGNCPGSTFEFPLLQGHTVRIEEKTSDQLFVEFTSGTFCLKFPDQTFTFTGTATFAGGTGQFSGATGTAEVQETGSIIVTGHKGATSSSFIQLAGTTTETLVLPKNGD